MPTDQGWPRLLRRGLVRGISVLRLGWIVHHRVPLATRIGCPMLVETIRAGPMEEGTGTERADEVMVVLVPLDQSQRHQSVSVSNDMAPRHSVVSVSPTPAGITVLSFTFRPPSHRYV